MPGTILLNYDMYVSHDRFVSGPTNIRQSIVQTNPGGPNVGTVLATTTGITITPGLTNLGVGRITNLDATNFVVIS